VGYRFSASMRQFETTNRSNLALSAAFCLNLSNTYDSMGRLQNLLTFRRRPTSSRIPHLVRRVSCRPPQVRMARPGRRFQNVFLMGRGRCPGIPRNPTIGQRFANDPSTGALAALPGSDAAGRVFFNPDFANNEPWTESFAAALLMHEALHNIGGTDQSLLSALGQDPNGPSDNITKILEGDCFYAGPWYHPPR
jgi:hypothetical protein